MERNVYGNSDIKELNGIVNIGLCADFVHFCPHNQHFIKSFKNKAKDS